MSTANHSSLNIVCLVPLALVAFTPNAQAPGVQLKNEPHYQCIFENTYARVFRVRLPENDAALLHQHNLPYVFVTLGPARFVDVVADKPAIHVVMTEGQVSYSQGGFAHIIRTEAGYSLDSVAIELLKLQGQPQNACEENQIVPGPPAYHCSKTSADRRNSSATTPLFDTDETHVSVEWFNSMQIGTTHRLGTLIVILSGSGTQRVEKGKPEETLSVGSTA